MKRALQATLEWIRPGTIRPSAIPGLEGGLRPNTRLDEADAIGVTTPFALDDVVYVDETIFCSVGTRVLRLGNGMAFDTVAEFESVVGALAPANNGSLLAAVSGVGIVRISSTGEVELFCDDPSIRECVTAMTTFGENEVLVTVGSMEHPPDEWRKELVSGGSSGLVATIGTEGNARIVADGLPWPSGVAQADDDHFLLSLSLGNRLEIRSQGEPQRRMPLIRNLAGYPGRVIHSARGGWWVAVPYLRNRATELILADSDALEDMTTTIDPDLWLVPTLGPTNVYREPMQVGQLRVMGIVKPWAPARSYGLAFRCDAEGRIVESAHSRVDGKQHGVSAIAALTDRDLVMAARGSGALLRVKEET